MAFTRSQVSPPPGVGAIAVTGKSRRGERGAQASRCAVLLDLLPSGVVHRRGPTPSAVRTATLRRRFRGRLTVCLVGRPGQNTYASPGRAQVVTIRVILPALPVVYSTAGGPYPRWCERRRYDLEAAAFVTLTRRRARDSDPLLRCGGSVGAFARSTRGQRLYS